MQGFDQFEDQDDGTIFRDVIMLTLLGFVTIVVILLPHLNPPVQASDIASPGNVYVQANWDANIEADVDLWVRAPTDTAVGYSNKGGKVFNLLRDDLGKLLKDDPSNFEVAFSRGAPAGEYVVNVHMFRNRANVWPLKVTLEINLNREGSGIFSIGKRTVTFTKAQQEITVLRFKLDENGKLVSGSEHDLPVSLLSTPSKS